jgi:glycine/D-amino acid oxidase-like deaminating enzyme
MRSGNGQSNSLPGSLSKTADIVILGAGVMGASIAFHLAKSGAGKVVILDKDYAGRGGSGRSLASVRMHYSYPPEVELALISPAHVSELAGGRGAAGRFSQDGFRAHRSSP